jgi:hypothetical protein
VIASPSHQPQSNGQKKSPNHRQWFASVKMVEPARPLPIVVHQILNSILGFLEAATACVLDVFDSMYFAFRVVNFLDFTLLSDCEVLWVH